MRVEIPVCARCCACVPLRYGIIIFGYLNLGFSIFMLYMEARMRLQDTWTDTTMALYRGVSFFAQVWFTLLLYVLDIIFNIILLVGAHRKKPQLMTAYYYYGVTTTLAALACYVVLLTTTSYADNSYFYILELGFIISGVVLQVYLLLLIRSELEKLNQRKRLRFTNHIDDIFVDAKDEEDFNV